MARTHKKAMRAHKTFKKRIETKKRVKKHTAKITAEDHSDDEIKEREYRAPLKLVRVINEEEMIERIPEEIWLKVKVMPYVIHIPNSYSDF